MECSIGMRIKSRNKERLEVVNKRKKKEAEANEKYAVKKQRRGKGAEPDFLEDITPAITTNVVLPPTQVITKIPYAQNIESQQDKSVKEVFSRMFPDLESGKSVASSSGTVRNGAEQKGNERLPSAADGVWDLELGKVVPSSSNVWDVSEQLNTVVNGMWGLDLGKSVPSSTGLGDGSEKNTTVMEKVSSSAAENTRLDVDALAPLIIEVISLDSECESQVKVKASTKLKLLKEGSSRMLEFGSGDKDDTSETKEGEEVNQASEESKTKGNPTVESLSSDDSSSSSSSKSSSPSSSPSSLTSSSSSSSSIGDSFI